MPQLSLTAERWLQIQEILVESWETDPAARDQFLAERCGDDWELLLELRALCAAEGAAERWQAPSYPKEPTGPRLVGPYQIDRILGRGGMGAVYLAHRADGQFEHQVAIKLIGLPFEIDAFRERFRRERQILAGLNHPNITRLLDGGITEDGDLFLAMEYVDGEPLDRYVRERSLDIAAAVRLFQQVCHAVQYAHQHLIIHRDIKPSNILVDKDGCAKLLDFGTAKLIEDSDQTGTGLGLMTAGYASPEQLRGEAVSTLSDVFSLGVVLYELLERERPFGDNLAQRLNGNAVPRFPTRLGDLENILAKALASEPGRRYSSVEQFSEDLARYLNGQPVRARPLTLAYRARKFVRRHRVSVAATALLVTVIAGSAAFAYWEQSRALREAERSRQLSMFVRDLFLFGNPRRSAGGAMTVKELLDLADASIDPEQVTDPAILSDLHRLLAAGFDVQSSHAKALELSRRALEEAQRSGDKGRYVTALIEHTNEQDSAGNRAGVLDTVDRALGLLRESRNSFTVEQQLRIHFFAGSLILFLAPDQHRHLPELQEAVRLAEENPRQAGSLIAPALVNLAESYIVLKQYSKAEPLLQKAAAMERKNPALALGLTQTLSSLGRVNRFQGRLTEDERYQHEAYLADLKLSGPTYSGWTRSRWAWSLANAGKCDQAVLESDAALDTQRKLYPRANFNLWTSLATAAYAHVCAGEYKNAEALAREALEALGAEEKTSRWHETRSYLGLALAGQKRYAEAVPLLETSINFYGKDRKNFPLGERLRHAIAEAKNALVAKR